MAIMDPISTIASVGLSLIDKLFPDKQKADEAKLKLLELQKNGELEAIKHQVSILTAEAKSTDKWTSRARPSFLYVIYIMIVLSIPMAIISVFAPDAILHIEKALQGWLAAIPEGLWALFGAGYLGYTGARSYDKKQIISNKN